MANKNYWPAWWRTVLMTGASIALCLATGSASAASPARPPGDWWAHEHPRCFISFAGMASTTSSGWSHYTLREERNGLTLNIGTHSSYQLGNPKHRAGFVNAMKLCGAHPPQGSEEPERLFGRRWWKHPEVVEPAVAAWMKSMRAVVGEDIVWLAERVTSCEDGDIGMCRLLASGNFGAPWLASRVQEVETAAKKRVQSFDQIAGLRERVAEDVAQCIQGRETLSGLSADAIRDVNTVCRGALHAYDEILALAEREKLPVGELPDRGPVEAVAAQGAYRWAFTSARARCVEGTELEECETALAAEGGTVEEKVEVKATQARLQAEAAEAERKRVEEERLAALAAAAAERKRVAAELAEQRRQEAMCNRLPNYSTPLTEGRLRELENDCYVRVTIPGRLEGQFDLLYFNLCGGDEACNADRDKRIELGLQERMREGECVRRESCVALASDSSQSCSDRLKADAAAEELEVRYDCVQLNQAEAEQRAVSRARVHDALERAARCPAMCTCSATGLVVKASLTLSGQWICPREGLYGCRQQWPEPTWRLRPSCQ